jgi:hypothetical protein
MAKFQGETGAQKSFEWAYGMEKKHKELYEKAKKPIYGKRMWSSDQFRLVRSVLNDRLDSSSFLRIYLYLQW